MAYCWMNNSETLFKPLIDNGENDIIFLFAVNQEEKGGVTQVTTIHMAAPVTSPPQHVVVNVNERQGPSGSGGPYGHSYPMPTPVGGPHSPPYPMTSHNLYPTPIQSPPPAYNYASAPQYSGEGDYIPPK